MTEEIEVLRKELYDLVVNNESFQKIYNISTELDLLIVDFYREKAKLDEMSA